MGGLGAGVSKSHSSNESGVQYYGGQENALANIFAPGGTFSDFLAGKPNAGFQRAQSQGLQQLQRANVQRGISNQPLGTRLESDYLQQTTAAAGDDWMTKLFAFMQPAGGYSKGKSDSLAVNANIG